LISVNVDRTELGTHVNNINLGDANLRVMS